MAQNNTTITYSEFLVGQNPCGFDIFIRPGGRSPLGVGTLSVLAPLDMR